jgi:alkylation response protein AidB-like acyl-CoA dehydrogenase
MNALGKVAAVAKVDRTPEGAVSTRPQAWRHAARAIAEQAFARAGEYDQDGAFPEADIAALHAVGLLTAILPNEFGGAGLSGSELCEVLQEIGAGSLPLGRLFEGHVNAVALVIRYGDRAQMRLVAREASQAELFGVWNTDGEDPLQLLNENGRFSLKGRKVLCSGAGHIARPLVTASDQLGRRLLVMPRLRGDNRADLSKWTALGMRASATGAVDFSGVAVEQIDIVGRNGDYERQPAFSGGAWRFAAIHLGGMTKLLDLLRDHLRRTGRGADPHQAARLGEAAIATETARLWVHRAAMLADQPTPKCSAEAIVAYVNLARLAVERASLDLLELIHRSVGLQGFMRPHPIERISRDLATYLRQPGPDRALTSAASYVLECDAQSSDLWR